MHRVTQSLWFPLLVLALLQGQVLFSALYVIRPTECGWRQLTCQAGGD